MFEEMFNLNCCIKSHIGEFSVQGTRNTYSVRRSIQEIWIAESNVPDTLRCLRSNIGKHDICWNRKESSMIYRSDWTMETGVFASTRCFGITCEYLLTVDF